MHPRRCSGRTCHTRRPTRSRCCWSTCSPRLYNIKNVLCNWQNFNKLRIISTFSLKTKIKSRVLQLDLTWTVVVGLRARPVIKLGVCPITHPHKCPFLNNISQRNPVGFYERNAQKTCTKWWLVVVVMYFQHNTR